MGKWIVVSNRLPFSKNAQTGKLEPSSGGLVSAISGIKTDKNKVWVGTAPVGMDRAEWQEQPLSEDSAYKPVFISKELYDRYYNGMANDVIWPLFHYEGEIVQFNWDDWGAYCEVNRLFAEAVSEEAQPGDLIWVHDFHLFLLPQYLKEKDPSIQVGFFLHIPFPSSEIFRQLPIRKEILEALLYSDLVGFHDYSYLRHFNSAVQAILGLESSLLALNKGDHLVRFGVYPVSIDTPKIKEASAQEAVQKLIEGFNGERKYEKLILGVDRLDYIKGIPLKFEAFREMLKSRADLIGRVSLLQVAVPSRTEVPEYMRLKKEIDRLVGEINGEFGRPNYAPVQYIFNSVPFEQLMALYRSADALLVTSKRDGMNLVALEYIAAQDPEDPGVVLLSEFAGAISTLSQIIPLNPWDRVQTARKMADALGISREERVEKHQPMLEYLENYTATSWAESFMRNLEKVGELKTAENRTTLFVGSGDSMIPEGLQRRTHGGERKLIVFSDYDGTLVPIRQKPEEARLSQEERNQLRSIFDSSGLELVMVSGRSSRFLTQQFDGMNIFSGAEHGAKFYDKEEKQWRSLVNSDKESWYEYALQVMKDYTTRVPGSFIEKKEFGISWHYRQAPPEFANYQARKLHEELEIGLSNLPVAILRGKKVIEARAVEANKGAFARWFLQTKYVTGQEVILAIGDDQTDEEIFQALPESAFTVKVGDEPTAARYRLRSQEQVIPFLQKVAELYEKK
jgi:trehalose 6-phosphate synthase/phosphatase